jgi:iron complex transport system substrate-binding protein
MRIVSLLPSATDIVVALGAADDLVGVSHSCGPEWDHLPRLTSTRIDHGAASCAIDGQVKSSKAPLYDLDIATLERLKPDVVVSQSLCDVCAVPSGEVEDAVANLPSRPKLINLSPFKLDDVPLGISDVGSAIGREAEAAAAIAEWSEGFAQLRGRVKPRLRVAFLDWLEPPFAAGHWIPDMIELLGCESVLAKCGEPSRETAWDEVRAAKPDIVIAACCGLSETRAAADPVPPDIEVHYLDGHDFFSRPSPRLLLSARMLAALLQRHIN